VPPLGNTPYQLVPPTESAQFVLPEASLKLYSLTRVCALAVSWTASKKAQLQKIVRNLACRFFFIFLCFRFTGFNYQRGVEARNPPIILKIPKVLAQRDFSG
jgi:hypothetical protein